MKSFLVALLLGFAIFCNAQNKITGAITNSENKILETVLVSIPELNKETISDSNGNFLFLDLPKGKFKISFSLVGYDEKLVSVFINKAEINLNIRLESSSNHLEEVKIAATIFNKIQSQNVMKIEHKSIRELQQKGAATLMEGLASIAGVSQVSTGTSIGKPVIRGLSGNRVLVYTQGVRLENQQFGEEHGLGLNESGIESVEVIKGPASLLYGSDALGGVLYFNPEKFAKPNSYLADFSQKYFSNTNGSNTSFGLKSSSENWKFLIRGAYNNHGDYKMPSDSLVTNTRFEEADVKTALGFSNSKFSSVLRYNLNHLNLGIPEQIGLQTTKRDPDYPRQGVVNHILSLHNNFYFRNSKFDADFGYISNSRKEFADSTIPVLDMNLNTLNYDLKYYLPNIGKLEAIIGVQGMSQSNKNLGSELLIPDAKTNDIGALLTTNYEWKSNVIQAGFRYDTRKINTESHGIIGDEGYFEAISKKYTSFNASVGYKTKLTDNLSFRLNVASGFRSPNLAELTSNGVHEGSNRYEIGNSNLKNEQNIQTDLNLEYGNSHFEFFANGFYNNISNYIFIAPNGSIMADNDVYDYVQANAKLYGGEFGVHFHPHPLDWLHITSSFETVTGLKENGEYLPLIPANKWNNNIRTEFNLNNWIKKGFATLNIESIFKQNNNSTFETKSKDYTLVNVGLGGNININKLKFDISINANNMLNKSYISHLSRLKTDRISNIGRNIVLGVSFFL
ncbi:TonB-dependent receptor [Flavobacterium psychrophilum]|uniref:TonB-dependent receptor n=1 Tax=Flavobacterium psychrophilum TaxID=96345 RepID=UPI000B7C122B|nr:TonB-dependent receptor [Flavobacterium psychrophilum]EKT4520296.1 TonB-dependent receptor [Flavobacterium psychrophilum]MCB6060835.1 TonB-dependent receptor [Flavobacterium psychrophilum]SNB34173.1 putative TonB-dependent outer membrane hemin receptor PhuR [Flavobacterium psychrophilum]